MQSKNSSLDSYWLQVKKDYKITEILGEGSFGTVVKGKHRATKKMVAIKFIKTDFKDLITCRNVIREISLLRQFTFIKNNIFTTHLLDVLVSSPDKETLKEANGIFLVMDYVQNDLQKLISND